MARLFIVEDNAELAALIDSAVRSRGHQGRIAPTGGAALTALDQEQPDLAIVDLLLPDISGREVLLRLKDRGVPAVAVSGVYKGDRFAVEATTVLGARAFFEKPFDMRSLLETVDQLVGPGHAPPPHDEEDELEELEVLMPLEEDEADEPMILPPAPRSHEPSGRPEPTPPELAHPSPPPPTAKRTITAEVEIQVPPEGAAPPPAKAPSRPVSQPPAPAAKPAPLRPITAVDIPLPFADRDVVWTEHAPRRGPAPAPEGSAAGALEKTSVPRLLTAYYVARHSGELKLRQGAVTKVVYFDKGEPVYAASNVAAERFGRFAARRGVLTQEQLAQVAQKVKTDGVRTAEAMKALGFLPNDKHRTLVEEQIREIISSTFTWKTGEYTFTGKRPAAPHLVPVRVFPATLILEGLARVETLVSLRQKLPPTKRLFPAADPPYQLGDLALNDRQALLLAYADGSKTVEDLLTLVEIPEKDGLATLLGLELLGVLVERTPDTQRRITFGL